MSARADGPPYALPPAPAVLAPLAREAWERAPLVVVVGELLPAWELARYCPRARGLDDDDDDDEAPPERVVVPLPERARWIEQLLAIDHPRRFPAEVAALRARVAEWPGAVATCTHPDMVDEFAAEEVVVVHELASGELYAARLDEHPAWPLWRELMRAGEFWSCVGEAWVVDVATRRAPTAP